MNNKQLITENFFRLWGHMETLQGEPIGEEAIDVLKQTENNQYKCIGRIITDRSGYYDVVLPIDEGIEYKISVNMGENYNKTPKQTKSESTISMVKEIAKPTRNSTCGNQKNTENQKVPHMQI